MFWCHSSTTSAIKTYGRFVVSHLDSFYYIAGIHYNWDKVYDKVIEKYNSIMLSHRALLQAISIPGKLRLLSLIVTE